MTSPHVTLGNTSQDIGSGINSFIKGQLEQQQRLRQIALQEALAKSTMAKTQSDIAKNSADIDYMGKQGGFLDKQGVHLGFEDSKLNADTGDVQAQVDTRHQENLPADYGDEDRLRAIDADTPAGIFHGTTKQKALDYIKMRAAIKEAQDRQEGIDTRFRDRGVLAPTPQGGSVIVRPNQPGGGTPEPVRGVVNAPVFNAQQHGQLSTDAEGNITIIRPNRPDAGGPAQIVAGAGKPLTSAERNFAGAGEAALSAHEDLTDWEQQHPEALNEIAKAISLPNFGHMIPGIGSSTSRVLQSFRLAGMSPDAQAYLKRMFDFAGVVGPKRYGLRGMQSEVTLQQLWTDFGAGQFGLTPEGLAAAEKNRANAVRQLQTAAGNRAWDQSKSMFPSDTIPMTPKPNRFFIKPPEDDLYDF